MVLENESEIPKCTEKRRREPVVAAGSGEDKGKLNRVFGPWEFLSPRGVPFSWASILVAFCLSFLNMFELP